MYRAALFSLVLLTMVIGRIDANNDPNSNGMTAIPNAVTQGEPTCKLYSVKEDQSFSFNSSQQNDVITAIFGLYQEIECFAHNYCSIRWFKNGTPVKIGNGADDDDISGLTCDNQTLVIESLYYSKSGNYTCEVTNGIDTIRRTTQLVVSEGPWAKRPYSLSAESCNDQTANIGDEAEFFCYFFAGDNSKDVELAWYKLVSGKWEPVSNLYTQKTKYEVRIDYSVLHSYSGSGMKPTAGMHLSITDVTEKAYGDYRLKGNNSYGQDYTHPLSLSASPPKPELDLTAVITVGVVVPVILIVGAGMTVLWQFKKLDFKIWWKNRFRALEDDDGKTYDAFISYADEDLTFALNIRERLEQSGYNVCVADINFTPATTVVEEIILALNTSRRWLIVISPDFVRSRHSSIQVDLAIDQMLHRQIKIVPVIYRDLSSVDSAELPLLKRILDNVRLVRYEENTAEKITKQLLVHMPPRRPLQQDVSEDRNLLRGFVPSEDEHGDENTPRIPENARGREMNRFLQDVAEVNNINPHAAKGYRENALLC